MFVRQVKRKCGVRGCKSTDCFAISRTREVGNTIIICKSCLGKALGAIDEIDPKTKSNIPATDNTSFPSLFFNAKALGADAVNLKTDDATVITTENGQETDLPQTTTEKESEADSAIVTAPDEDKSKTDNTTFKCPVCGKEFDSEKGLKAHMRYCKPQANEE